MNDNVRKPNSAFKFIKLFLSFSIIFCTIFVGATIYWCAEYLGTPKKLDSEQIIIFEKGSSLTSISNKLAEHGVIEYPRIFTLINRFLHKDKHVQAGQYQFSGIINPNQVFEKITSGNVMVHKVTFAEGLMTFQIIDILKNAPYLEGEVPQNIEEGELLPETYDYKYGDTRFSIIERMRTKMQESVNFAWENKAENLPLKTKEEAVILASIIEKETGIASERTRVAGVFINRLKKRMRLQTDPTVIYAITKGKFVLDRPIRKSELEANDPYNTYRNYGLPPTPIAAPGKASIEAALNPMKTDELYFVADGTGSHKFAKTLKEHNNNVAKWRKISK